MNNRVKKIRKELGLSQEDFGRRLGVTGAAISRIEKGERKLTDQMIRAICNEYNVLYGWLTEGVGEDIFDEPPTEIIDQIVEEFNLDDDDRHIIVEYLSLSDDERMVIKKFIKQISAK